MARELLVFGDKTFKITVPEDAKITFGPFSPPTKNEQNYGASKSAVGTLRIYQGSKENIIAMFSGVKSFRDLSMGYAEEVAREEGAVIWKSDQNGYEREERVQRQSEFVDVPAIEPGKPAKRARTKR